MDKFVQLINAILCLSEFHKHNKREYRFYGIREIFDSSISSIVFILILSVGIFMGVIHIPTYMGDGYSYDNFDCQERDAPGYNLYSVFFNDQRTE